MMSPMSEATPDTEITPAARMGRAIGKGALIGFPVCIVGITLAVFLITDLDLGDSFNTALLPGILLGGFGGGFAGMAATMDSAH